MSAANIRETAIAMGVKQQSAVQTPLVAADMVSLLKTNPALANVVLNSESDAAWIGKPDEFATKNYPTSWEVNAAIEAYLSSQHAGLICGFGLGKGSKATAGDGFKYTFTPLNPITDGIDMPVMTMVEAIRQGAGTFLIDRALIGLACEDFTIDVKSGAGLDTAMIKSNWIGCGKFADPSTITVPAVTSSALVSSATTALTILGTNYISAKSFVSSSFTWKNNIRKNSGYFPGAGSQNGGALMGRMEHGDREIGYSAVVRLAHGSTELAAMEAQTEGTVVQTLTGGVIGGGPDVHSVKITLHRVVFKTTPIADEEGIVTIQIETQPLKHASNGLVTIEVITDLDNILTVAS